MIGRGSGQAVVAFACPSYEQHRDPQPASVSAASGNRMYFTLSVMTSA